jgi:hypothetical protein
MKIKFILAAALFACLLSTDVSAQNENQKIDIDQYLAAAETIVIAKILSTSPLTRGGDYHTTVEILHVIKGAEKRREIVVGFKWISVEAGKTYLLSTQNKSDSKYPLYFHVNGYDSAIETAPYTDIAELKKLSVRIAVLRTMNLRQNHLENEIRRLTSELQRLKELTKDQ